MQLISTVEENGKAYANIDFVAPVLTPHILPAATEAGPDSICVLRVYHVPPVGSPQPCHTAGGDS